MLKDWIDTKTTEINNSDQQTERKRVRWDRPRLGVKAGQRSPKKCHPWKRKYSDQKRTW